MCLPNPKKMLTAPLKILNPKNLLSPKKMIKSHLGVAKEGLGGIKKL